VNLSAALRELRQFDAAVTACRRAIEIDPQSANAYRALGVSAQAAGLYQESLAAFAQLVTIQPQSPEAHYQLAIAHRYVGQLDQCISELQRVIELKPDSAPAYGALGPAYYKQGRIHQAIESFRKALAINPNSPATQSALLYTMQFDPSANPQDILNEHKRWAETFAKPLMQLIRPHLNDRTPDRPLRIGYISPDFLNHPVGRFLMPLFSNQDHSHFKTICYNDSPTTDDLTAKLKSHADEWYDTARLCDETFARKLFDDRIDIAVDLVLHAARNRSLALARKPAPIQICYLAYPGTTGLPTMDYRLTDPYLDPPGNEHYYTEETIPLPNTYWCYWPHMQTPETSPLPQIANGFVTFGCLNNFPKVSMPTLQTWAKILEKLPSSKLSIHAETGSHVNDLFEFFGDAKIDRSRIEVIDRQMTTDYLQTYNRIDIALDPFPYNGGTTTCDALWMGVPVIALAGTLAISRAGVSLLSNVGLTDLIGQTPDEYVEIALKLAGDLKRLEELRESLRSRMAQSPLRDEAGLARAIEFIYRNLWQKWCSGK
jgi:predicted O-linked N-acetylglucosamine transferase (SPINDLY family)